jgi:hypothetical protein
VKHQGFLLFNSVAPTGTTNELITGKQFISIQKVRNHVKNIYEKLQVHFRAQMGLRRSGKNRSNIKMTRSGYCNSVLSDSPLQEIPNGPSAYFENLERLNET